jgi:hypothetical protein
MIDKPRARHLTGETIREIGILLVVFAPLDAFFQHEPPHLGPLSSIIVTGLLAIVIGIIIEARE